MGVWNLRGCGSLSGCSSRVSGHLLESALTNGQGGPVDPAARRATPEGPPALRTPASPAAAPCQRSPAPARTRSHQLETAKPPAVPSPPPCAAHRDPALDERSSAPPSDPSRRAPRGRRRTAPAGREETSSQPPRTPPYIHIAPAGQSKNRPTARQFRDERSMPVHQNGCARSTSTPPGLLCPRRSFRRESPTASRPPDPKVWGRMRRPPCTQVGAAVEGLRARLPDCVIPPRVRLGTSSRSTRVGPLPSRPLGTWRGWVWTSPVCWSRYG